MVKKEQEGFKEYTQRWHKLAPQVQPPITKREMVTMFIDTLPSPYYDRVVGNVASNIADLVVVGERIDTNFTKKLALEKKKGETNVVLVEPVFPQEKVNTSLYSTWIQVGSRSAAMPLAPYILPFQPRADVGAATRTRLAQQGMRKPHRVLAPIPMTYIELLPLLLEQKLVEVVPLKPLEPPYPRSYDPNAKCDYHGGAIRHTTERCWSLKHKVQDLLNGGLLGFEDKGPNVHSNPLPTHGGMVINAISHENRERVKCLNRTLKELATPDVVYQPWCIQYPQLEPAQTYELKSGLIHLLPKFHGLAGEDPHRHLKEFHMGIPEDYIKMKTFPFSLDRAAKDWLYLQLALFNTWGDMKHIFLEKFFPASKTTSI
ncbi:hypothetical protein CR513_18121, partial [Mucuna pruriens]